MILIEMTIYSPALIWNAIYFNLIEWRLINILNFFFVFNKINLKKEIQMHRTAQMWTLLAKQQTKRKFDMFTLCKYMNII